MRIYLYESLTVANLKALTVDATGGNLPVEHGPWEPSGNGAALGIGDGDASVRAVIEEIGYFIAG